MPRPSPGELTLVGAAPGQAAAAPGRPGPRRAGRASSQELGQPAYRARQVSGHYFDRLATDPAAWTDVPAGVRAPSSPRRSPRRCSSPVRELACDEGMTRKTLWRLFDGTLVESVLMRYPATATSAARATVCVSSQAGCGMNCPFCATGQAGLTRNLSAAEIVEQVVDAARALAAGADARRARPGHQRRVHGHGRAAGQLPRRRWARCAG